MAKTKSPAVEAIATISRATAERLHSLGFRRRAPHLFRQSGDVFHGIVFQAGRGGTQLQGSFTINLTVSSPAIWDAWLAFPFPVNPAMADFPIRARIGTLLPYGRDHWWPVTQDCSLDKLTDEVVAAVTTKALGFLDAYPDHEAILAKLRLDESLPGLMAPLAAVVHGIAAKLLGHQSEADEQFARAAGISKVPGFVSRIRIAAKELGIAEPPS